MVGNYFIKIKSKLVYVLSGFLSTPNRRRPLAQFIELRDEEALYNIHFDHRQLLHVLTVTGFVHGRWGF